jgi:DNA primase
VPYRLPKLIEAVNAGQIVYIVEGEKDVHAIELAGAVATCNPGGAGNWRDDYDGWFVGARVVIVADKDDPGRKHAAGVAGRLRKVARSVTVVEAVKGKDAADHLAAGFGLDDFEPATWPSRKSATSATSAASAPMGAPVVKRAY